MLYQQDEVVSSCLFSFRQTSCPLFRIFVFCLFSHLAPLKCQQNLVFRQKIYYYVIIRAFTLEPDDTNATAKTKIIQNQSQLRLHTTTGVVSTNTGSTIVDLYVVATVGRGSLSQSLSIPLIPPYSLFTLETSPCVRHQHG